MQTASGYSQTTRRIETVALVIYVLLESATLLRVASIANLKTTPVILLGALLGYLGADFISGFLHWAADTWGNPQWPIIGQSMIRTFREHHIDPKAITRHDLVETNGAVCMFGIPFLSTALYIDAETPAQILLISFLGFQCLWGSATGQIHKWAHQNEVSALVKFLQKSGIILSPKLHNRHHAKPHIRDYCINSGWMNIPLDKFRFFVALEHIVQTVTKAVPREDDLGLKPQQKYQHLPETRAEQNSPEHH